MAVTLAEYLGATAAADKALVEACAAEAALLVAHHIGTVTGVPKEIQGRAVLEVGADLFNRRKARNGIVGLDNTESAPTRIRSDPMKAAAPLLAPYLGPGIA